MTRFYCKVCGIKLTKKNNDMAAMITDLAESGDQRNWNVLMSDKERYCDEHYPPHTWKRV